MCITIEWKILMTFSETTSVDTVSNKSCMTHTYSETYVKKTYSTSLLLILDHDVTWYDDGDRG